MPLFFPVYHLGCELQGMGPIHPRPRPLAMGGGLRSRAGAGGGSGGGPGGVCGLRGRGGVGNRLRSFLFAALTREPDTEDPGLLDFLRRFRSRFSFSLFFFSFFILFLDELLVDDRGFFSFFSSFLLGASSDSLLGVSTTASGAGSISVSLVRPSSWPGDLSWVTDHDVLLQAVDLARIRCGSGRIPCLAPSLQQTM